MQSFSIWDVFLMLLPVVVIAGMLAAVFVSYGRSLYRWFHDNAQPVLTTEVKVLSKREELRRSMQSDIVEVLYPFKSFYITFEMENGRQLEFLIPPNQVSRIDEGKLGRLTYQGSRFKSFVG